MNGRAPKLPATGSHVLVRQKLRPKRLIDNIDCRVSSKPMPKTMRTRTNAKAPVPRRNPRSAEYPRAGFSSLGAGAFTLLRYLDLRERGHLHLNDAGG